MRAMILAAGRGERMGELTMHTPKPLLRVGGHFLIEYAIANLKKAGIEDIVINVSYLADQIKSALGNGSAFGVNLFYSHEPERLETGGGIFKALPLLGDEPFIVVSADIVTLFPFHLLLLKPQKLAHLIMVPNPTFHPAGDFGIEQNQIVLSEDNRFTFGNIGIYHPDLFRACQHGYFPLVNVLRPAIASGFVTGELFKGLWHNIGTSEDLHQLNLRAREDSNLRPSASETNTLSS